jgi:rhomboid protease GluP
MIDRPSRPPGGAPAPSRGTAWIDAPADKVSDWALVLDAESIDYRRVWRGDGYAIAVASGDLSRALEVLSAFERENPADSALPRVPSWNHRYAGLLAALAIVAAYVLVPPSADPHSPFRRGASVAGLVRAGEIWRVVTALTLHADALHLISNVAGLALFGTLLCTVVGPGGGLALMTISGALGNWLNALIQPAAHSSVGASTAVFGAVGCLVGIRLAEYRRRRAPLSRIWAPFGAGLVLLAMMGAGERSDVLAHVLGFCLGAAVGVAAGRRLSWFDGRLRQLALGASAVLVVGAAWLLALR